MVDDVLLLEHAVVQVTGLEISVNKVCELL